MNSDRKENGESYLEVETIEEYSAAADTTIELRMAWLYLFMTEVHREF